jgi:hypothetical protein
MIGRCDRCSAFPRPQGCVVLALLSGLLFGRPGLVSAQTDWAEPRVYFGKATLETGSLLSREGDDQPWKVARDVFTRDRLLALGGLKTVVAPVSDAIKLVLWGNLPAQSPLPILESSAILHDTGAFDLDITLLSGRAVITNTKKKGSAKIWLRMPGEGWEVTLDGPGSTVALDLYGRWPHGVPFVKNPFAPERPISVLSLQVIEGSADVRFGGRQQRLGTPPGPSILHWDSVEGAGSGPQRLDKLPDWATGPGTLPDELKSLPEVVASYLKLCDQGPVPALLALLTSADSEKDANRASVTREFAVLGLAACGALPHLAEVLASSHSAELRETIVLAMRHWIGSAPGRDLQLYAMLIGYAKYTERQADTLLQLLHSPFDPKDPATYQTLIAYLQHDKPAIRALARWHLYRLVPSGAKIAYDPNGTPEARAKAAQEWKQLIPDGSLPK